MPTGSHFQAVFRLIEPGVASSAVHSTHFRTDTAHVSYRSNELPRRRRQ
jgi:hypothetical protein